MHSKADRTPSLASSPLFAGLSPVALARLVGELDELSLSPGSSVFERGEPGECLYVVRSGLAEARAGPGDGADEYPLAIYEPGDSFGESALLTDEPRSSTVVALTDLELWALPKERFLELVEQNPKLALNVGQAVSRRLQATHRAVSSLHPTFDLAAEQAYATLDPELQSYLCRTSPLDPVRPEVAARALGRPDAVQVLAYLAARLPFVRREDGQTYRYHKLFRELLADRLRAELGEPAWLEWLRHLAECCASLGQVEQAVHLLLEAGQTEAAQRLALTCGQALLAAGQADRLERFISGLPASPGGPGGKLSDLRAEALVALGREPEAVALLEDASVHADLGVEDAEGLARRYRRLAELYFQRGQDAEGARWLRRAGEVEPGGQQTMGDFEALAPLPGQAQTSGGSSGGLMALAQLAGLRRAAGTAGALGGRGLSGPAGLGLSALVLAWFWLTSPPAGLSTEAYLALGVLAAALPLLIFSVLGDHLVTLLMVVAWAGLGLVPGRVALSGFATSGWFLVLAVLAVGVALARSGLLYRLVLSLLARVPSHQVALTLVLAGAGLVFSPVMPNATARTALVAPLALEISDALGYARRSRGSAAIALAVLLGFGQMCTLFLTGSSSGLLVHSLLPPDSRARFGWVGWFVAALPLHLVVFGLTYLAIMLVLRPGRPPRRQPETVQAQRRVLGPLSRAEWISTAVFVFLILAFAVGPLLLVDPAWPALLAMVVLGATNVLDQQGFKSGINWAFLIFFGVMLSLAEVFATLGVDTWLAAAAAGPLAPLAATPALFLLAVALVGYLVNLVVRWQAACVLMTLVLVPAVAPLGIEPWVVGITALVTTNMWFLPYQSTIYQALYYGADEQAFSHAQVRPIALIYGVACLVGLLVSVPFWQALSLLPG